MPWQTALAEEEQPGRAVGVPWVFSDADAAREWDGLLARFPMASPYQGYSWGEYRRAFGWRPLRLVLPSGSHPWALAQCLVREFPLCRIVVVWIPLGPLVNDGEWEAFGKSLRKIFEGWRLYIRIEPPMPCGVEETAQLIQAGWRPVRSRLNSGKTIVVSLQDREPERRRHLSSNWRHNLVRGERQGLLGKRWSGSEAVSAMFELYREMVEFKRIKPTVDEASLGRMFECFGKDFILIVVRSSGGAILAARGGGRTGTQGLDLFAATSSLGRQAYASYVALWRLMEEFHKEGVLFYDLGGVDPKETPGVHNFKRGVGGVLVERVGEWEWCPSATLSRAVNLWVRTKRLS